MLAAIPCCILLCRMDDQYLPTVYTAHITVLKLLHDRALSENKFDHVVVFSGAQHPQFLDDMYYPFKANPHFRWWVPLPDNQHCFVIYTPGVKPLVIYYQPVDYWHKPPEAPIGFWTEKFDIHIITEPDQAKQYIPKGKVAFIGEWEERFKSWGKIEPNPEAFLTRLHFDRAAKTEYETECVRRANVSGARGHRAAEQAFRAGQSEYEIHLSYLRGSDHTEPELPYGNIIALNEHAAVLHYYHHERAALNGDKRHSFLIDAGASFNGYASDITRTYSSGKDEFQDLIDAMETAQQALCATIKPRVNYIDVHLLAHVKIAEILSRFKFVNLAPDAIVEKGISSTFLPHGVGHFIGLQVHDVGGFLADAKGKTIPKPQGHPYLRLTRVVEPKQIFTIEPGLYFIEPLLADLHKSANAGYVNWDKVDEFRKYGGVRIEDDLAVTEMGHINLTRDAFANAA
jgi:Xaa-Pro dipeptidase